MRRALFILLIVLLLALPAAAAEPTESLEDVLQVGQLEEALPEEAQEQLEGVSPAEAADFSSVCKRLLYSALAGSDGALHEGLKLCAMVLAIITLCALVQMFSDGDLSGVVSIAGALGICAVCAGGMQAMISLSSDTIETLSDYSACLLPVMASALAMSGGVTSASALYSGTVLFSQLLMRLITKLLIPAVYFYIAIAAAEAALSSDMLSELREFVGWLISKSLRILLYAFTGFMTLTGVISGSSDAAALRRQRRRFPAWFRWWGAFWSDASDTLLASASILKNSAGIFGMLAVLALCLAPFLQVGVQYLLMKVTAAVSGTVGSKPHVKLVKHISTAMGYLLGMTGACALMLLISAVCFLKVVS